MVFQMLVVVLWNGRRDVNTDSNSDAGGGTFEVAVGTSIPALSQHGISDAGGGTLKWARDVYTDSISDAGGGTLRW